MIIATSEADFVVLVIDSTIGGFEAGISKGGQTREYALLAYTFGVKQMICCCNKMDATTLLYSEARYNEIKKEVSSCLMEVGYDLNEIPFIPMYGFEGDNIIESSTRLSWYRGPTLHQALKLLIELKCPSDELNHHPLQEVYKTRSVRTVPAGGVKTCVRKPGMPGLTL
ncbi:elongation factor 1-alpha-like [Apium graveolens]|uniref:elongation factor 1-alpha-like n=1 Tax=Apium graveolens TaxID=4045 RepID=UPI003D7A9820